MERLVAAIEIEQDRHRMHQHFPQQATAQMPGVARPHALDHAALIELAEDSVNAVAYATEQCAPAGMRIVLGAAVGREQVDTQCLPLKSTRLRAE